MNVCIMFTGHFFQRLLYRMVENVNLAVASPSSSRFAVWLYVSVGAKSRQPFFSGRCYIKQIMSSTIEDVVSNQEILRTFCSSVVVVEIKIAFQVTV